MADNGGRISFGQLHPGPDPLAPPVPGPNVIALTPAEETASRGPVPIVPTYARRATTVFRKRSLRAVSGHGITHDKGGGGRPRYTLLWQGIDTTQMVQVRDFLEVTCGAGAFSFETPLDGAGSAPVVVRATQAAEQAKEHADVHTIRVDVEAVFVEASP